MGRFLIFGGGGKVARHFTRLASGDGHSVISVIRDDTHSSDLKSLGAEPAILSLETASVSDITSLLTSHHPDAIIFAAGAGGKGDKSRTRKVDYEGALKVFDAAEDANVKRVVIVGATDIRDRSKGYPEYYSEDSKKLSDRMWEAIPASYILGRFSDSNDGFLTTDMQAKYDAEVELHKRKALQFTVVRPGGLTDEPAKGAKAGITQLGKTSRELVAKALLIIAQEPKAAGLTIDLMDGDGDLSEELKKAVDEQTDAWTG